jgi:hypothetical protein
MRWRLFLEEFAPQFHYIKGERNTLADALSRLPHHERRSVSEDHSSPLLQSQQNHAHDKDDDPQQYVFVTMEDNSNLLFCLLNFPEVDHEHPFLLAYSTIANAQLNDPILQQFADHRPDLYPRQVLGHGNTLILYEKQGAERPKICLPNAMLGEVIAFYHKALGHMGAVRLEASI